LIKKQQDKPSVISRLTLTTPDAESVYIINIFSSNFEKIFFSSIEKINF